jgi:hypothetical protein
MKFDYRHSIISYASHGQKKAWATQITKEIIT